MGIQRWLVPMGRQRPRSCLHRVLATDRRHHAISPRPGLQVRMEPHRRGPRRWQLGRLLPGVGVRGLRAGSTCYDQNWAIYPGPRRSSQTSRSDGIRPRLAEYLRHRSGKSIVLPEWGLGRWRATRGLPTTAENRRHPAATIRPSSTTWRSGYRRTTSSRRRTGSSASTLSARSQIPTAMPRS